MTANLRIVAPNAVDDSRCVLTCSVSQILPATNLQNVKHGRILRVAAGTGIQVKGTYGGDSVHATMMSFLRHNMESDSTFQFEGFSDAAWTTKVIDTGPRVVIPSATLGFLDFGVAPLGSSLFDPYRGQKWREVWFDDADMVLYSSDVIASWRLTLTDPTNTSGYIDLSRLWVGQHFETDSNPIYGAVLGWLDESQSFRTDGGDPHTDAAVPYRGGKFDLQNFPEADRLAWMKLARYCGPGRRPFYLSLFPSDDTPSLTIDYSGEFIFRNPLPQLIYVDANGGAHNTTITIEET